MVKKHKEGYIVLVKTWYGWRKMRYKDYGAKGRKVKVFKTLNKAKWALERYAALRQV